MSTYECQHCGKSQREGMNHTCRPMTADKRPELPEMKMFKPTVVFHGPIATHDMPCACCHAKPAVYEFDGGVFAPCWDCQHYGWELRKRKPRTWFKLFFGDGRGP